MQKNIALFLLLITFSFQLSAQQVEITANKSIMDRIKDRISSITVGFNIKLIDTEIANGLNLNVNLRPEVQPSYLDNYYTRFERSGSNLKLSLADMSSGVGKIMPVDLGGGYEVFFARQFANQIDAFNFVKYPPYGPSHIPLNARTAIDKLVPGDFFNLKTNLSVLLTWAQAHYNYNALSAGASAYWIFSGQFYVQVFRLNDNHVRVKLIGLKKQGPGANAEISIAPHFHIFNIGFLDNAISRLLKLNIFEMDKEGLKQIGLPNMEDGLVLADYDFNLTNAEAANAYDELMGKFYVFKDKTINTAWLKTANKVLNPFNQEVDDISKFMITNLVSTEEVYEADRDLPVAQQRIHRNISAVNASENDIFSYKWGLGFLFSSETKTTNSQNKITYTNAQNQVEYFGHFIYENAKQWKRWFGTANTVTIRSLDILCASNSGFDQCDFKGMGIHYERTDTDLSGETQYEIDNIIKQNLPESIYNQIPWGEWATKKLRKNAYIKLLFLFKKETLNLAFQKSRADVMNSLYVYLKGRNDVPKEISPYADKKGQPVVSIDSAWEAKNLNEMLKIVGSLAVGLDNSQKGEDRLLALQELRDSPLFQQYGAGFMINTLSEQNLGEFLHVQVKMSANDTTGIDWSYGYNENVQLYKSFILMQTLMNNRSIDPRINELLSDEIIKKP